MKNKYAHRSRVSEKKIREIVRYFAADLTALQAAQLSGLNRDTINRCLTGHAHAREGVSTTLFASVFSWPARRSARCSASSRCPLGDASITCRLTDESFFGARRVKGKRGRGAYGKTVVFGVFEHDGKVYTEIVPDCSKATLQGIIRGRVDPASVINLGD